LSRYGCSGAKQPADASLPPVVCGIAKTAAGEVVTAELI
jgi:hypothetical protein